MQPADQPADSKAQICALEFRRSRQQKIPVVGWGTIQPLQIAGAGLID
jgi:hypothetical protein